MKKSSTKRRAWQGAAEMSVEEFHEALFVIGPAATRKILDLVTSHMLTRAQPDRQLGRRAQAPGARQSLHGGAARDERGEGDG